MQTDARDPGQPWEASAMFTLLKRPENHLKTRSPRNPPLDSRPNDQQNVGVSMKFQYGNGDKPLEGYVIKRGVGSGGFGEVYFAESESGKEVALKRIQKNLEVEVRGVRHCLNLRHPNLVGIFDIRFDKDEQGWIVMEFIAGESLRDRIDRHSETIDTQETLALFAQLAAGVAYLHDQGIVHRDLKPANVFIDNGLVKIGDYGLSKYISASRRGGQTESVGTFHYMAPEIGKGQYGKEIDIYSLGVILYEMLTGVVPFDGESSQEIILKHLTAEPDVSILPQPYAGSILKALSKNASDRFRDCREFLHSIGWELDRSGMATPSSRGTAAPSIPPVLKPLTGNPPTTLGQRIGNNYPTMSAKPAANRAFASPNAAVSTVDLYEEPVARAFQQAYLDLQNGYRRLPAGTQGAVIIATIISLILFGSAIAPLAFMGLCAYAVYYVIWYMLGGPKKSKNVTKPPMLPLVDRTPAAGVNQSRSIPKATPRQPVSMSSPVPYRLRLRNWQQEQRELLKGRGIWSQLYARTYSWTFSGIVIAVLALGSGLLAQSRYEGDASQWIGGIAWTSTMALLTSWTILFFTRRWETKEEDSIVYRFVLMTAGVGLGLASYSIADYLAVPWHQISSRDWSTIDIRTPEFDLGSLNRAWKGFYDSMGSPLLPAHIAYFASTLWIVRWWRQADVLRKNRFSFWAVAWSVAMAALVQGIFDFPTPWCLIMAATTSIAIQMASPWKSYHESKRYV